MNEFIVRLYYRLTKCETQITGYRQNLREAFAHQYPTLAHVTEQNIADRRAAIFWRNLIPESRRNEIKDEVQREISNTEEQASEENGITPDTLPEITAILDNQAKLDINEDETELHKEMDELERQMRLEFNKAYSIWRNRTILQTEDTQTIWKPKTRTIISHCK